MKFFSTLIQAYRILREENKYSKFQVETDGVNGHLALNENSNPQVKRDWHSVQNALAAVSIHTKPSFDLSISRRGGNEFQVKLTLLPPDHDTNTKDVRKTPIRINAGLHDLYW